MKIQEALNIIDEMTMRLDAAFEAKRRNSTCSDKAYYDSLDATHAGQMERYAQLRDAVERGLDY